MKASTRNDHQEAIARAIAFMEAHLDQALTLEEIASQAHVSPWHFHRLFTAYQGESLAAHLCRLRLQRAAQKVVRGQGSITQIALDAGFETPSAFNRAFKRLYGCSPRVFVTKPAQPLACPSLPQTLETPMQPEFRTLNDIPVLKFRQQGPYHEASEVAWAVLMKHAYKYHLLSQETAAYGVGLDAPDLVAPDQLRYEACISVQGNPPTAGGIVRGLLPGGLYACFLHKGPYEELGKVYQYICREWLPQSGETLRDAPFFEQYLNRNPQSTKPENLRTLIHIPLEAH